MPDNPPPSPSLAFWLSPLPERQKHALLFYPFLLFSSKSQSHAGSLVQRQSRPASLLWNGVMNGTVDFFCPLLPPVSHPLLSPPPSVCEERCSRLSSILLSSLSGLSCSLSLTDASADSPCTPAPSFPSSPLSLSLSLQRQSFMHLGECACMHKQPSTSHANAHNYDGGWERE